MNGEFNIWADNPDEEDFKVAVELLPPLLTIGKTRWDEIKNTKSAFGDCFDYRILDLNVIMPLCPAAVAYFEKNIPDYCDRYSDLDGNHGWAIDHGLSEILAIAARDGLISEETYVNNMENEQLIMGDQT